MAEDSPRNLPASSEKVCSRISRDGKSKTLRRPERSRARSGRPAAGIERVARREFPASTTQFAVAFWMRSPGGARLDRSKRRPDSISARGSHPSRMRGSPLYRRVPGRRWHSRVDTHGPGRVGNRDIALVISRQRQAWIDGEPLEDRAGRRATGKAATRSSAICIVPKPFKGDARRPPHLQPRTDDRGDPTALADDEPIRRS